MRFLRAVLNSKGRRAVARPVIDLQNSFTTAARVAGIIGPADVFDPFANDASFLFGAFVFEDVGVTAYKGDARLFDNGDVLEAVDGSDDRDQGLLLNRKANLVPTDGNSIAFSRSTRQVLNIVYLGGRDGGGFFPSGLNGAIR